VTFSSSSTSSQPSDVVTPTELFRSRLARADVTEQSPDEKYRDTPLYTRIKRVRRNDASVTFRVRLRRPVVVVAVIIQPKDAPSWTDGVSRPSTNLKPCWLGYRTGRIGIYGRWVVVSANQRRRLPHVPPAWTGVAARITTTRRYRSCRPRRALLFTRRRRHATAAKRLRPKAV